MQLKFHTDPKECSCLLERKGYWHHPQLQEISTAVGWDQQEPELQPEDVCWLHLRKALQSLMGLISDPQAGRAEAMQDEHS